MNLNPWVAQELIHHHQADISRSTRHTWIERRRRRGVLPRLESALARLATRSDADRRRPTLEPRRVAMSTGDPQWTSGPDAR
jgi:hypothetical protein